ncbi:AraC family transcriptional regulator [Rhodococcus tibetensis]|uniref:AraC family transcriptional regulator n=1 Tax=Rhodococcus tibetensis TaxID=2965064 RepID=A0ABT1QNA8_9NOCA|nr:AraC family transcriptional regulator [Rhodococcus sp. FXJ9.536]MCQ4122577.1 AraC family transcriptional regulator [Rhodococcus sp. FXJ9.536]
MSTTSKLVCPGDWDEASHVVSDVYFPHRLTPLSREDAGNTVAEAVELGPVKITHISWGADVSIRSEHPGAYAVNVPLSGHLESVTGKNEVSSVPGSGTICPPDTTTLITDWSKDCSIIGVRVDRDYLHREMARILARPGLRLPPQLDLTSENGASWLVLVRSLLDQMLRSGGVYANPFVAEQLSGAVTTALVLAAIPDDETAGGGTRPRIVKRVIDEIHSDPARAWTAAEMAEIAGVGIRRLQEGFQEYVGVSPRDYLLDVRLERVHADLLRADTSATISDVAMRWGFTHTGRFAAAFRKKYGSAPSDVLRG